MTDVQPRRSSAPELLIGPVRLRALNHDDWALECELSRDVDVVRWTYYPANMTERGSRRRLQELLERQASGLVKRYVVSNLDGHVLGTCGIGKLQTDVAEIFYALLPSGRGQGAATAATKLLLDWALTNGYPTVGLETVEGNNASERVAQRAGFTPVERFEDEHRGEQVLVTRWLTGAGVTAGLTDGP